MTEPDKKTQCDVKRCYTQSLLHVGEERTNR